MAGWVSGTLTLAIGLGVLAGCSHPGRSGGESGRAASRSQAQAAYRPPPEVTSVVLASDGRIRLEGVADPNEQARLDAPSGPVALAMADRSGRWRATLAAAGGVRLLGLSMADHGREVHSQGYLALAPDGTAAQLRAGAGALSVGVPRGPPAILALDFDRRGAAVISGRARAGVQAQIVVDGANVGQTTPGADGRFSLDLPSPLTPGVHTLAILQGSSRATAQVRLPELSPPAAGPFQAQALGDAWLVTWVTPGGGVQGTLLFQSPRRA